MSEGYTNNFENCVAGAYLKGDVYVYRKSFKFSMYGYIHIGGFGKYWGRQFQCKCFRYE